MPHGQIENNNKWLLLDMMNDTNIIRHSAYNEI